MIPRLLIALLMLGVALGWDPTPQATAGGEPPVASQRYGAVTGTLYWWGIPQQGCMIEIENDFGYYDITFTDQNGKYLFSKLPPGAFYVTGPGMWASNPDDTYRTYIEAGKTKTVNFEFW